MATNRILTTKRPTSKRSAKLETTIEDICASFQPGKRYTKAERKRFSDYIERIRPLVTVPRGVPPMSTDRQLTGLVDDYDGYDFAKFGDKVIPFLTELNGK